MAYVNMFEVLRLIYVDLLTLERIYFIVAIFSSKVIMI